MESTRKSGIVAGAFFVVAAVAAIAGLALYDGVLHDPGSIATGTRDDTAVLLGACCELVLAISVVGTATTLYPVVRRHGEGVALSYVAGRVLEAAFIAVGIMCLLAIVTLRRDAAGHDPSLIVTGKALVALHDRTFLFGPGFAIGVNTTLLASLMYRSRLVPRAIAIVGLIGGPLVFASSFAVLFGLYGQTSAAAGVAALPVFAWEMSLAAWMIARGLAPSPARGPVADAPATTAAAY
jgi:hypothetical protein